MATSVIDRASPGDQGLPINLTLPVRAIAPTIWALTFLILVCGYTRDIAVIAQGADIRSFGWSVFWLDSEANLPTWYSSTLLLVAAALLFLQFRHSANGRRDYGWLILSVGFLLMAVDEASQLHDLLTPVARAWFEPRDLLSFGWVIFATPLAALVALYMIPFLLRQPLGTRVIFIVAGLLYVAGAVGMEMLGGRIAGNTGWGSPYYIVGVLIEESLELIGVTLFLTTLLRHMARERVTATLAFA
jgi:hypothetical protein